MPLAISLAGVSQIGLEGLSVLIGIDELIPSVVRRIDIDQFDFAKVRLLKKLQHFQVITLDEQVLCFIKIDRLFPNGLKRGDAWLLDDLHALSFAGPIEAKPLLTRIDPISQDALELIEVDRAFSEHFRKRLTEAALQLGALLVRDV